MHDDAQQCQYGLGLACAWWALESTTHFVHVGPLQNGFWWGHDIASKVAELNASHDIAKRCIRGLSSSEQSLAMPQPLKARDAADHCVVS